MTPSRVRTPQRPPTRRRPSSCLRAPPTAPLECPPPARRSPNYGATSRLLCASRSGGLRSPRATRNSCKCGAGRAHAFASRSVRALSFTLKCAGSHFFVSRRRPSQQPVQVDAQARVARGQKGGRARCELQSFCKASPSSLHQVAANHALQKRGRGCREVLDFGTFSKASPAASSARSPSTVGAGALFMLPGG